MGVIYQDEDGNQVPEDQLYQYEEVPSNDKPTEGFWERTGDKTIANFVEKYGNVFGGGEALASDFLTNPDVNIFSGETWGIMPKTSPRDVIRSLGLPEGLGFDAQRGMDRKQRNDEFANAVRNSGQFENNTTGKLGDLASTGIANTASMGAAFINPYAFAAEQGLGTLGREYADLKDQGYDFETAASTAGERGAFDAANNYIFAPLDRMAGSGLLTDAYRMGGKNINPLSLLKGSGYLKGIPKTAANISLIGAGTDLNRMITDETMLGDKELSDVDILSKIREAGGKLPQSFLDNLSTAAVMGGVSKVVNGKPKAQEMADPLADGPPLGQEQDINPPLGLPYFPPEYSDITAEGQRALPMLPEEYNAQRIITPDAPRFGFTNLPEGQVPKQLGYQPEPFSDPARADLMDVPPSDFARQIDQLTRGKAIAPDQASQIDQLLSQKGQLPSDVLDPYGNPLPQTDRGLLSQIDNILNPDKPLTSSELRTSMDLLNQDPSKADEATKIIIPQVYEKVRSKFSADAFLPESTMKIDARDPAVPYEVVNEMPTLKEEYAKPELVKTKIEEPTTGEKSFPDSIDSKLKKAQEVELKNPPEKLSSVGPEEQAKGPLNPNPEAGSINLKPIADFGTKVKDNFLDIVNGRRNIEKKIEDINKKYGKTGKTKITVPNETERALSGELFGRQVPGASALLSTWKEGVTIPKQLAREGTKAGDPGYEKAIDRWQDWKDWRSLKAQEYRVKTAPLFDLTDPTKVNEYIQKRTMKSAELYKQGKRLVVTDEAMRAQGLSDNEIKAIKSADTALSELFDASRDTDIEETIRDWEEKNPGRENRDALNKRISKIKQFYTEKKMLNYFPIHRFGKNALWAEKKDAQGNTVDSFYNLYETKKEQLAGYENLIKRGFNPEEVRVHDIVKPTEMAHIDMPTELRLELDSVLGRGEVPSGFKSHMIQRKFVPGYEIDSQRNMAEYLNSAIEYQGKRKFQRYVQREIDGIKGPRLKEEAQDWYKDVEDPEGTKGQAIRTFLGHYHMGFGDTASPLLNATQSMTSTYPELYRYTDKPMKELAKAWKDSDEFFRNPEAFAKKNPELYQALLDADAKGVTGDSATREMAGLARRGSAKSNWETAKELSMILNSTVEKGNRVSAFIAGYKNAPKGADPVKFASDFTETTQYNYGREARPKVARGWGAPLYTFKLFQHNYIRNVKNAVNDAFEAKNLARIEKNPEKKAEYIRMKNKANGVLRRYMTGMTLTGGAMATPPYVAIKLALDAFFDIDLEDEIKTRVGKLASDVFHYGALGEFFQAGFTSNLAPSEMAYMDRAPKIEELAYKTILGAPGDLLIKGRRAVEAYNLTKSPDSGLIDPSAAYVAGRELAPKSVRNKMLSTEWANSGEARDIKGNLIMEPTGADVVKKFFGITPKSYIEGQRVKGKLMKASEEVGAGSENLIRKVAMAMLYKDTEKEQAIRDWAEEKGIKINESRVRAMRDSMDDPYEAIVKRTPKRGREQVSGMLDQYRKER